MGIIVPRHRHSAVERNRLKRRLRELVRLELLPGAPGADVVVRARREAYDASFDELKRDVVRAADELRQRHGGSGAREAGSETSRADGTNAPPTA